ncbi:SxtJ family membrane protein [Prochlorococcus marinus]|uniref:SxtJ family membrane protein n=1 Tax=Prochlorococcus marinus TaxID=1219 RepID=UPI001ADB3CDC|nr:SxtJ family membrane protein [Prochlorococcus marinus]MBO8219565.1 hypothetical protein [Prochlorococcus marinus CUG1416]MBW3051937.1 hypothetical protein [Prochlorococcus marinus str. MU1416]
MKKNFSKKILREFGFLVGFIFPILIGWLLPVIGGHSFRVWTLWFSFPLLIAAIIKPILLYYPYKAWMKIGNILGWFNSNIILGLVFIIVLIPISMVMKMIGYDPLKLHKSSQKSYREIKVNYKVYLKKIF